MSTLELTLLLPAVTLTGAWLGYSVARRDRAGQKKSGALAYTADLFAWEARRWPEIKINEDDPLHAWHRGSIHRLSGYAGLLQRDHPKLWEKIRPHWEFYTRGKEGDVDQIYCGATHEDFVCALYQVADALRETLR